MYLWFLFFALTQVIYIPFALYASWATSEYQKWYYDKISKTIIEFRTGRCLTMSSPTQSDSYNFFVRDCIAGDIWQRFIVPTAWLWSISTTSSIEEVKVRVASNLWLCMSGYLSPNDNTIKMGECRETDVYQKFYYDRSTRQIQFEGKCLDYDAADTKGVHLLEW